MGTRQANFHGVLKETPGRSETPKPGLALALRHLLFTCFVMGLSSSNHTCNDSEGDRGEHKSPSTKPAPTTRAQSGKAGWTGRG